MSGRPHAHDLDNKAWASASAGPPITALFATLARASERQVGDFNAQELANTAWAFVMAGQPACALLDPISVLDVIEDTC